MSTPIQPEHSQIRFTQDQVRVEPSSQETESSLRSESTPPPRASKGSVIFDRLSRELQGGEKARMEFVTDGGAIKYEILQSNYGVFYYRFQVNVFKEGQPERLFQEYLCVPMDEDGGDADLRNSYAAAEAYGQRIIMGVNYEKNKLAMGNDDDKEALVKDLRTNDFARITFVGKENVLISPKSRSEKLKNTRQMIGKSPLYTNITNLAKLKFKEVLPIEATTKETIQDLPPEQQKNYNNLFLNQQMREASGNLQEAYLEARAAREELEIPHTPEQIDQEFAENVGKRVSGLRARFDERYEYFHNPQKLEALRIEGQTLAVDTAEEEARIQEKPSYVPRALYNWWNGPIVYQRAAEARDGLGVFEDAIQAADPRGSPIFQNLQELRRELIAVKADLEKEIKILEAIKAPEATDATKKKVNKELSRAENALFDINKKLAKLQEIGGDLPPEEQQPTVTDTTLEVE
ncbi:MAG: hypothetical protein KDK65_02430 [Chlamydiia bacterium]|nr:hypothetical protein [Chlamydiia bacterium]